MKTNEGKIRHQRNLFLFICMAGHSSMYKFDKDFGARIIDLCHKHYNSLGKKGKPQQNKEWTLFAAIVQSISSSGTIPELKVVAVGTGSKCLSHSKIKGAKGWLIHDSHAEVIARRSFLCYLYQEIEDAYNGKYNEIFSEKENGLCELNNGVNFHLYTSHTPCGDASIFPKTMDDAISEEEGIIVDNTNLFHHSEVDKKDYAEPVKRKLGENSHEDEPKEKYSCMNSVRIISEEQAINQTPQNAQMTQTKIHIESRNEQTSSNYQKSSIVTNESNIKSKTVSRGAGDDVEKVSDIYRTGAKCVEGGIQDLHGAGHEYHTVGALRTKPGRGERTWSMSCSDKMAKWNVVGIQGALLSQFLCRPIYLKSVIVGSCPFSKEAMQRALIHRSSGIANLPSNYQLSAPVILKSDENDFVHSKKCVLQKTGNSNIVPSSSAIIWWSCGKHEVSVEGHKQGVISKHLHKSIARCDICKLNLLEKYQNLLKSSAAPTSISSKVSVTSTYKDCKNLAQDYQLACQEFYKVYKNWVRTPQDYYDFVL